MAGKNASLEMPTPLLVRDPSLIARMKVYALQRGLPVARAVEAIVAEGLDFAGVPATHNAPAAVPEGSVVRHGLQVLDLLLVAPDGLQAKAIALHFAWSDCTTSKALAALVREGAITRTQVKPSGRGPWPFVYKLAAPEATP